MRLLRIMFVVGAMVVGGCGSSSARPAAADPQVESGSCQSSGTDGHTTTQSCSFVFSDGEQFRCHKAFEGSKVTARMLEHSKACVRLRSLVLSAAERRMIAALDRARGCLTAQGIRALGGPVLPPVARSADGELVVGRSAAHAVYIAFYTDAARAQRLEAELIRNAHRLKGQVQRQGAVTVLWIHPSSGIRAAVQTCAFG